MVEFVFALYSYFTWVKLQPLFVLQGPLIEQDNLRKDFSSLHNIILYSFHFVNVLWSLFTRKGLPTCDVIVIQNSSNVDSKLAKEDNTVCQLCCVRDENTC